MPVGIKTGGKTDNIRMLAAGASTQQETMGRVVGLDALKESLEDPISTKHLNVLFAEMKTFLSLHQLSLTLPEKCDSIIWPDLSSLRVLKISGTCTSSWRLDTLLPNLSLVSLTVATDCKESTFINESCLALGDFFKSSDRLKEVVLSVHKASTLTKTFDKKGLAMSLSDNLSLPLERLELDYECAFSATAVGSLVQFISNSDTLQHISIERCTMGASKVLLLTRAINTNSNLHMNTLKNLTLTVHGDSEAKDLAQLLFDYPDMARSLDWSSDIGITGISNNGAVALAQVLCCNPNIQLERLLLSDNNIGDVGAVALAQALYNNNPLVVLNLTNSDIGTIHLAQALRNNTSLRWLYLSKNNICDEGAVALAQALHHSSALWKLDLSDNDGISELGTKHLVEALTVNTSVDDNCGGCLTLPNSVYSYATQCKEYDTVRNKIRYH